MVAKEALPMLSTLEISKTTGIPYGTLYVWMSEGYLVPTVPNVPGYGGPHLFSVQQCLAMAVVGWFHTLMPDNKSRRRQTRKMMQAALKDMARYSDAEMEYLLGNHEGPEAMAAEEKFAAIGQQRNTMQWLGNKLGDKAPEAYKEALIRMRDCLKRKMARMALALGRKEDRGVPVLPPRQQHLATKIGASHDAED